MLVLDRKVREGFWIEGNIFVKVLAIGRNRVKLGIEAPDNIKIAREELRAHPAGDTPDEGGPALVPEAEGSLRMRRRS